MKTSRNPPWLSHRMRALSRAQPWKWDQKYSRESVILCAAGLVKQGIKPHPQPGGVGKFSGKNSQAGIKSFPNIFFPPKEGRILTQNSQLSPLINPRIVPHSCPGIHHKKIFKWHKKTRQGRFGTPHFQGIAGFLKNQFFLNDNIKYYIKIIKLN